MTRSSRLDRRTFLASSSLAAAGLAIDGLLVPSWAQDARGLPLTKAVETGAGRMRGLVRFGVNQFYGVPYGASTAGAEPLHAAGEAGARGPACATASRWATGRRRIRTVRSRRCSRSIGSEPMGEDCLNLNVFTPALGSGSRPVMVWLHGGGFSGGSGNWLLYDGTNLARKEDVVVVSRDAPPEPVRLPAPGRSRRRREVGATSSNVGMQDIVAALGWVKENIAAFGGNPEQRDRVRPVRRRRQGDDADGDAVGEGTLPSRHRDERLRAARRDARERDAGGRAVPREARAEAQSARSAAAAAVAAAAGGVLRRAAHPGPRRRAGGRRQVAAARSVDARRAGVLGRRAADDGLGARPRTPGTIRRRRSRCPKTR